MADILSTYPFNQIGRVIVKKGTKNVVKKLSDTDSTKDEFGDSSGFDATLHDICAYFPAFYSYDEYVDGEVKNSILTEKPVKLMNKGNYSIPKAFRNSDGGFSEHIVVGTHLASIVGTEIRSVPNVAPISNPTISELAKLENILDVDVVDMIRVLAKFIIRNTNAQQVVGLGYVNDTKTINTGSTLSIGNKTGISSNGKNVSLFGLEDFYGNVKQYVKGAELTQDFVYVNGVKSEYTAITSSGYVSKTQDGNTIFPSKLTGSANTHYTDVYSTGVADGLDKANRKLVSMISVKNGELRSWFKDEKPLGWDKAVNVYDNGVFMDIPKEEIQIIMSVDTPNNRMEIGVDAVVGSNPDLTTKKINNTIDISSPTLTGRLTGGVK